MRQRVLHCLLVLFVLCAGQQVVAEEHEGFSSTIPVVDMNDFYNPSTRQKFVDQVAQAAHEVGFFAVVNPDIDVDALIKAYQASQAFFSSGLDSKNEIFAPKLNGQRGYVPSETAQGYSVKDFKEFIHIGRNNNLWPTWMNLQTPMESFIATLDHHSEVLQKAFAMAIGESEDYFINMTRSGECLLRALYYPKNPAPGTFWAAKHTDIDLFTILPMATEEGLQVLYNDEWIDVKVPSNAFIVNCGDKLQNLTNGYFKSSWHQVVSKPNVERYSIVYFVHPRDQDSMGPTERSIAITGGIQRYPEATSLELLASRLRELGLAGPQLLQYEKESGVMDRVQALVEEGVAAEPVQRTYAMWLKNK